MSASGSIASGRERSRARGGEELRNRFFVWSADAPQAEEFTPELPLRDSLEITDKRYFFALAHELDRLLPPSGITFLVTWQVDAFDERFRDAVVLLVGDEKYQVPSWADRVKAIYKTGGTRRNPLPQTLRAHPSIAWRLLLREARNTAAQTRRRPVNGRARSAPMHELPIGYFNLTDTPHVPFDERETDVFFAGSVESDVGFTVRPRLIARRQMAAAVERARERRPRLTVDYTNSGPFANPAEMLDPTRYSQRLMAAKIALCPRGNIDETFRLVEAARFGCVAISEPLPERWYNRDAPVIEIERWSALPDTLEALLADPSALERRSESMRRWWEQSLSEHAAARFIAATVEAMR